MRGFLKLVKHFADYFSTRLRRRAVSPVNHRASYYEELSFYRQAFASRFFPAPISLLNWHSRTLLRLFMAFLKTAFVREA